MLSRFYRRRLVCRAALIDAGGGTLALNLPDGWEKRDWDALKWIRRARDEQGWLVAAVASLEDLLAFAREFARRHYQPTDAAQPQSQAQSQSQSRAQAQS